MKKGKGNFFILFLHIVSATVLCGYFSNTILFQQSLNNIVGEYVSENNRQLANHISYRLKSGSEYISDFADTLSRMPEFLLTEDLLDRKADALELERIIVVNEDGTYLSNSEISEDCQTWIKENNHLWEGPVVFPIFEIIMLLFLLWLSGILSQIRWLSVSKAIKNCSR